MKKIILFIFTVSMLVVSCNDDSFNIDYNPPVDIHFEGVDESNIITVNKGVMNFTAAISVQSFNDSRISSFEIYYANAETGSMEALIEGESQFFEEGAANYETSYVIHDLIENRCIKIVVTDNLGNVFERNLLVKISPSVIFSKTVNIETVENYYGPYYATWNNGRVYMRRHSAYKNEVDFSLGGINDNTTQTSIPHLVNPSKRDEYGLLTMSGLVDTKFELTDLSMSDYVNITQVDEAAITSIEDPSKDIIAIEQNKVYVFRTSTGKKGLICILQLSSQTGTIETSEGEWTEQTTYHEALISTKVLSEN